MKTKTGEVNGSWVALETIAEEVASARKAAGDSVAEVAAGWVGPQYLLALREELAARSEGADRFKLLRQAAGDVVVLQRGDVRSARLGLEREKLEFQRQKHKDRVKGRVMSDEGGKRGGMRPMTEEELKACVDKVDEIMGLRGPTPKHDFTTK